MAKRIEVGYVCGRGHFCFYADPEESGECGSKRVGTLWAEADYGDEELFQPFALYVEEAEQSLNNVYEHWRKEE